MRYLHGLVLLIYCCLTAPLALCEEQAPALNHESASNPPWLDEVRAQREAWEARRRAAQQESTDRLRQFDPWGAAQLDALDFEAESYRQAVRNRSELIRRSAEAQAEARRRELEWRRGEHEKWLWQYSPYPWDDPWFSGGY